MKKYCFIYQNAFSQTGGIQTFNKHFISALEEISKTHVDITAELVGIYDNERDVKTSLPFKTLGKSKIGAFRYIIKNTKRFNTFIFAHVNLAPLAIILHLLNPKARIIFCTHGIEIWKKLPRITEWIMNRSTVLTVSSFSEKELKKYNPNLTDVKLFPNCIKINIDDKKLPNPYNTQNFNILSVTRLSNSERLKGIDTVIKALPLLKEKIPTIKYSVIGKGDDVKRLKKIAYDLEVSEFVNFLGFVEDINVYYQYCDLFALPSKKEGFGIVYLEAMQYKKPLIAVNYGGPTDVVIDGETGFLCEYDDSKCLAERITQLYVDPSLSATLGKAGYQRLMDYFTFGHFTKNLYDVFMGE